LTISAKLNREKTFVKIENSCTGTFLVLNKDEAIKLREDMVRVTDLMEYSKK